MLFFHFSMSMISFAISRVCLHPPLLWALGLLASLVQFLVIEFLLLSFVWWFPLLVLIVHGGPLWLLSTLVHCAFQHGVPRDLPHLLLTSLVSPVFNSFLHVFEVGCHFLDFTHDTHGCYLAVFAVTFDTQVCVFSRRNSYVASDMSWHLACSPLQHRSHSNAWSLFCTDFLQSRHWELLSLSSFFVLELMLGLRPPCRDMLSVILLTLGLEEVSLRLEIIPIFFLQWLLWWSVDAFKCAHDTSDNFVTPQSFQMIIRMNPFMCL